MICPWWRFNPKGGSTHRRHRKLIIYIYVLYGIPSQPAAEHNYEQSSVLAGNLKCAERAKDLHKLRIELNAHTGQHQSLSQKLFCNKDSCGLLYYIP